MDAYWVLSEDVLEVLLGCDLVSIVKLDLLFFNAVFDSVELFLEADWREHVEELAVGRLEHQWRGKEEGKVDEIVLLVDAFDQCW